MCPWAAAHVSHEGYPGLLLARRPQPIAGCPKAAGESLLVPPLDARLPQQLAMLLLGHSLAALLDDGAHDTTLARCSGTAGMPAHARYPPAGHTPTFLHANGIGYRPSRAPSATGSGGAAPPAMRARHAVSSPRRKNP